MVAEEKVGLGTEQSRDQQIFELFQRCVSVVATKFFATHQPDSIYRVPLPKSVPQTMEDQLDRAQRSACRGVWDCGASVDSLSKRC